ncbi:MAG: DUF6350 family protein [Actinomycetes bacterium]
MEQRRAARKGQSAGAGPPSRTPARPTPEGGQRQAWTRVGRSRFDAVAERLSSPSAGAVAGLWAGAVTLLLVGLVVMISWILGTGAGGISGALRMAGNGWLVTHHLPVSISGGSVSALPLGFAIIPALALWRAGCWATRRNGACRWQEVRTMTLAAAGVYGTFTLVISGVSSTDSASVGPLQALIGGAVFAAVCFGAGAGAEAGLWNTIADRFTVLMRRRLRAAATGFMVLVAGAAALLAVSMFLNFGTALDLTDALMPGLVGNLMLLVLSLAYLPNAVIWSIGYVCGPGFAVGQDTIVSPLAVQVGDVPAFPLLAAIPESAPPWALAVLLIPLIAGAMAAKVANRAKPGELWGKVALIERAEVAGMIAVAVWAVCMLGSGSLGSGRMSDLGPGAWRVGGAALVLTFAGGWLADLGRRAGARFAGRKRAVVDLTDSDRPEHARRRGRRRTTPGT